MSLSRTAERTVWSWEAYLDWEGHQPLKDELVDGAIHAMTGGTILGLPEIAASLPLATIYEEAVFDDA